jgi:membrane protein implicated in regulation of membrane protease activity
VSTALGWQVIYWYWWILAVVLLIIEALAPGFFFLWMAAAAVVVGLVLVMIPDVAWQYQLLIFAVLSVSSIVLFKRYQRSHPSYSDQPALSRRGEHYLGRIFTLDDPVVDGIGKLRVDDTIWRISGRDSPAGAKVEIIGVDGVTLRVRVIDAENPSVIGIKDE